MSDSQPVLRPTASVRFVPAGRRRSFLLPDLPLDGPLLPGSQVIIEDADGLAVGTVVGESENVASRRAATADDQSRVVRKTTVDDVMRRLHQQAKELEATQVCRMKIRERGLEMKLTRVEHAFDGSRLTFYYTAEHRIDFRELVRDLAAVFHMRIEMRQIGVRDEARLLGGYGSCGRPLCCTTWLTSFEPVSIKMAKQQGLSLNPSKLAGVCGRLKCCLRYELPNAKGERHAGCGQEGSCAGGCNGDGACGQDGCSCGK
ncbi:MAG TPA: regulatory iron-sulfur-containing complex subunit RicT [Luteitalea sp.]|nr:regulatory iron-sulfur-containing complex subunit RicT [Luteitalea sp.]